MDHPKINGLILAAGKATRMGRTKQLLKLNDKAMLQYVIEQALTENFKRVGAVIGHDAARIKQKISVTESRFSWILNHSYSAGQSTSLREGMRYLMEETNHVMVFLGDLPFIEQETIRCVFNHGMELVKQQKEPFIVRPVYKKRTGHPVFFGHIRPNFFDQLKGDVGAKKMMTNVHKLFVEDKGVIWDIDTVEEYKVAQRTHPNSHQ